MLHDTVTAVAVKHEQLYQKGFLCYETRGQEQEENMANRDKDTRKAVIKYLRKQKTDILFVLFAC